jgi:HPt (histidine-containing phosphotransfer) domain-containing protein
MRIPTMIVPEPFALDVLSLQCPTSFALPPADLHALLKRPPIDYSGLLEQSLRKPAFAISLLEAFASTGQDRIIQMEQHLAHGNLDALAEGAHALKGVAGVLAAQAMADFSAALEMAGRESDVARVQLLVPQLRQEIQRVLDDIPRLCEIAERHIASGKRPGTT